LADDPILVDFAVDPPLTGELRADLIDLWGDVAEKGGSVGVAVPVDPDEVRALANTAFGRCERGEDHMIVASIGFEPVGLVFLEQRPGPLFRHWATVKRLQVHPVLQGHGIGGALMRATHEFAREVGLEQLHLTVRGGTDTERFYERFGYKVVAVLPGVIRVGEDDDRDELYMIASSPF
jgi:predicted N-acetyltransferase YhbS